MPFRFFRRRPNGERPAAIHGARVHHPDGGWPMVLSLVRTAWRHVGSWRSAASPAGCIDESAASARRNALTSISVCAVLASVVSPQAVSARLEPEPRRSRELHVPTAPEDRERVVFEGYVLTPDGGPAEGVMVLCSAGGKAVTDAAGDYRLEVEVPLDATSVQVTAVGRAEENQVASTSVPLSHAARARPMNLGPLQLVRTSSCSPRWLPAFGGEPGTKL